MSIVTVRPTRWLAFALWLLACAPLAASAAVITRSVTGTLSCFSGCSPANAVNILLAGKTFTGTYSYDTSVVPTSGSPGDFRDYSGALDMSINIGGGMYVVTMVDGGIEIFRNHNVAQEDQVFSFTDATSITGTSIATFPHFTQDGANPLLLFTQPGNGNLLPDTLITSWPHTIAGAGAGVWTFAGFQFLIADSSFSNFATYRGNFTTNTVAAAPTVTSISPAFGPTAGGTAVTITGANLTGATGVTIGGTAATSVVPVNSTTVTAIAPAHVAGTASVVVTTGGGSNGANTLYRYIARKTDFDNTGRSDVLFRNSASGQLFMWLMNGLTILNPVSAGTVDNGWGLFGNGDYNGDGKADMLFRNSTSNEVYIWLMNGQNVSSHGSVAFVNDPNWVIIGNGDFDGNGKSDILWRNSASGQYFVWLMNGLAISGSGSPATVADPNWSFVATGDFNGDGKSDILLRNAASGELFMWLMNGTAIGTAGTAGVVISDLNWKVAGIGDFNGDGKADILFRHLLSGEVFMWIMNGTALSAAGTVFTVADLNLQIVAVSDLNGDGKSDILWRHINTGQVIGWLMNGGGINTSGTIAIVADGNWVIKDLR